MRYRKFSIGWRSPEPPPSWRARKAGATDMALYYKIDIVNSFVQIIGYFLITVGFYYARYTKYLPQKTITPLPPQ